MADIVAIPYMETFFIIIDTALSSNIHRTRCSPPHFYRDSQLRSHNHLENILSKQDHFMAARSHTPAHGRLSFPLGCLAASKNFFQNPGQVALVVEPHKSTGGFFVRQQDGSLDQRAYFGFYELTNHSQRSVVFWRNLRSVPEVDNEIEEDAFI